LRIVDARRRRSTQGVETSAFAVRGVIGNF
jgi:hypothetical protein